MARFVFTLPGASKRKQNSILGWRGSGCSNNNAHATVPGGDITSLRPTSYGLAPFNLLFLFFHSIGVGWICSGVVNAYCAGVIQTFSCKSLLETVYKF
ncbi:hypothetical protein BDW42DRAFT_176225 [Aspergillus taichungensis]|uniref:Uncharacterized protein n=1 Tax=Aspergillus taichungensis TaxID=482145 RepID=A0A2J5HKR0_9EURO|nr:hypothetical protein BDW42DRAFT_176225 [Aspergillus taichungensis]